jgi:hypothetical protein
VKHGADEGQLLFHPLRVIDGEFVHGIGKFKAVEETAGTTGDVTF